MTTFRRGQLERKQVERCIAVMQRGLSTLLADSDFNELDADRAHDPEKIVVAPDAAAYFHSTGDITALLSAASVVCNVIPTSPDVLETMRSGDGGRRTDMTMQRLRVALVFAAPVAAPGVQRFGRLLEVVELVYLMASIYKDALIWLLLRDAPDGVAVTEAFVASSFADAVVYDELGLVGRAVIDLDLRSVGVVPVPQFDYTTPSP